MNGHDSSTSVSPPEAKAKSSPKKRKLEDISPIKSQVSKFIGKSNQVHSLPVSRNNSPAEQDRAMVSVHLPCRSVYQVIS